MATPEAGDWSLLEVEATVADYFDMLEQELRGRDYNKSDHRRRLARLLNGRTDGAIERKHRNISAILIKLGFVYVSGYKPLPHYQRLLLQVVSARLEGSRQLVDLVRTQVSEPVLVPGVEDILAAMVEPPTPDPGRSQNDRMFEWQPPGILAGLDYVAREASNRGLGAAGEALVCNFEIARLARAGMERLAGKVERVSATRGDGMGFDVLSFETSGAERWIEVKTTAYGASTPFFVSRNEVKVSRDASDRYHLYRVFNFRRLPRLFAKQGPLEEKFALDPTQYVATVA